MLRDDSARRLFLAAAAVDAFGSGLFMPASVLYFIRVVGLGQAETGGLLALAAGIAFFVPLIVGSTIDRVGSRKILMAAFLLQGAGTAGYLAVTGTTTAFLAILLCAVGQRLFWSSFFTFAADVAGSTPSVTWFARINVVTAAAAGAGGIAAGFLFVYSSPGSYVLLVVVNSLSFFAAAVFLGVLRGVPGARPPGPSGLPRGSFVRDMVRGFSDNRILLRDRTYLKILAVGVAMAVPATFFSVGTPVYISNELEAPSWVNGWLLAVVTLGIICVQSTLVRRWERSSKTRVIALSAVAWFVWSALMASGLLLDGWAVVVIVFVSSAGYVIGESLYGPFANALVEELGGSAMRGRYLANFQYTFAIANIVAPGLVAALAITPAAPWLVLMGLCAGCALVLGRGGRSGEVAAAG